MIPSTSETTYGDCQLASCAMMLNRTNALYNSAAVNASCFDSLRSCEYAMARTSGLVDNDLP
jgi:hypothetical protein